jgi:hypothetical protein
MKGFLDNKKGKNLRIENRKFSPFSFFPKNRKGDVPITILVIGVFAVCTLALFSFSFSVSSLNKSFETLEVMEKVNIMAEINPSQEYYDEIEKREFSFSWDFDKEVVVFSVRYFGFG